MRRRQPHGIELSEADRTALRSLVRDGRVEQRIARRARVLLAMAETDTVVEQLAAHMDMDRSSLWHLCRRFEQRGLEALADAPRAGRPRRLSPLGSRAHRAIGLLRADGHRLGDDALVDTHPG